MELPSGEEGDDQRLPESRRASKAPYRVFYWAFRASAAALMSEAEFVKLRLPLKDHAGNPLAVCDELSNREDGRCSLGCQVLESPDEDFGQEHRLNDKRMDFITAPFVISKRHLFYGTGPAAPAAEKPRGALVDGSEAAGSDTEALGEIDLTGAQRIYLTHSLLHRLDISKELRRVLGPHPGAELCSVVNCIYCQRLKWRIVENRPIVLEHLLDAKVFADEFALHEEDLIDEAAALRCGASCLCGCCGRRDEVSVSPELGGSSQDLPELTETGAAEPTPISRAARPPRTRNLRRRLRATWRCCCRYQPLRLIRLYFGERLAFYYAWIGHLICSLLSLVGVGLVFLVYGLVNASMNYQSESDKLMTKLSNSSSVLTDGNAFSILLVQLMQFIRLMFENHLTIPFGCVLTAWSVTVHGNWRKHEADLSNRWGVNERDLAERKRPGFAPWKKIHYPVCCQQRNQCRRCFAVFSFVLLCVSVVIAVAVAFEVAKLVASKRHCSGSNSQAECIFLSIILPIAGHLLLIGFLDWAYSRLAKKMTDWENHSFASDYEASYAMKAFALRCANNYASLFYIAFVRREQASFGEFSDRCTVDKLEVDCFSLLNVYTAGYIIGKSLLKCVTDSLRPCLASEGCLTAPARRLLCLVCASFKRAAYAAELRRISAIESQLAGAQASGTGHAKAQSAEATARLVRERNLPKEKSRDELLDDYLEKIVLHGYLVLFGSACHVIPLAVLLALLIDLRLDARRMVSCHRRSVPQPGPGLRVWNRLRALLNHAGIYSTGAVLAFTNNSLQLYGGDLSVNNRLVFFVAFTGAMHLFKYLMNACYSAGGNTLQMRLKWEYLNVPPILDSGRVPEDALDGLQELQDSGRWYHVLLPCFGGALRLRPEAGPHQA